MAGKRRPIHTNTGNSTGSSSPLGGSFRSRNMNFRPNTTQDERRGGTKPTTSPTSVGLVLITMILHVCRKSLLFDVRLKIAIYCGSIFIVSLIADYIPMPRSYFSRSDNALNQWFVKWGWGWLLVVTVPWITLTAHTLACGRRPLLIKHLCRMVVATFAWAAWIRLFHYIETNHGRCLQTKDATLQTKANCLQAGKFWSGFDISGHTFILIYSNLILAEEGKTIVGWEGIKDLIVKEEHSRNTPNETSTGHMRNLSSDDLEFVKKAHALLTPYLRGLFVAMTLQQILWDIMLVSTMLYYHIMLEKMLGCIVAIGTWYLTYHCWYKIADAGVSAPGEGLFRYNGFKEPQDTPATRARRNTLNGIGTRFMGLPIRTPQDTPDLATSSRPMDNDLLTSRTT